LILEYDYMKDKLKISLIFLVILLMVVLKPNHVNLRKFLNLIEAEQQGPFKRIDFFDKIYNKLNKISESELLLKFSKLESFIYDFGSNLNTKRYSLKLSSKKHTKFEVSIQNINKRFKKDNSNLPEPRSEIVLNSFKNDWQSFQVLVIPIEFDINNISINVAKKDINRCKLECFIGEFVNCEKPYYKTDHTGWYVDPLIPLKKYVNKDSICFIDEVFNFNVKKNQNKSIWFNIYTPENIESENLNIPLIFKIKNETKSINLKLKIEDKILSSKKKFKDIFGFQEDHLITWNNYDTNLIKSKRKDYYDFLLKYNLNPVNLYETKTWPPVSDWRYCKNKGANIVNFTNLSNWKCDSLSYKKLKIQLGLIGNTYKNKSVMIYIYDELQKKHISKIKKQYSFFRKIIENYNVAYTTAENIINNDEIFQSFRLKKISNLLLKDSSSWNYICNTSVDTNKNFFIDKPISEIQQLGKILKRNHKKAFLYYGINEWKHNFPKDTIFDKIYNKHEKWPFKKWNSFTYKNYNGDGQLIYPGLNGEIWPSVRLIHIREMLTYLNN
tara:strand:+ start:1962 stop:3623 length:1662 start_codon:yes stop_codon:yes gene_type:complete